MCPCRVKTKSLRANFPYDLSKPAMSLCPYRVRSKPAPSTFTLSVFDVRLATSNGLRQLIFLKRTIKPEYWVSKEIKKRASHHDPGYPDDHSHHRPVTGPCPHAGGQSRNFASHRAILIYSLPCAYLDPSLCRRVYFRSLAIGTQRYVDVVRSVVKRVEVSSVRLMPTLVLSKRWGTQTGCGQAAGTCSTSSRRWKSPWGSHGRSGQARRSCSTWNRCCSRLGEDRWLAR